MGFLDLETHKLKERESASKGDTNIRKRVETNRERMIEKESSKQTRRRKMEQKKARRNLNFRDNCGGNVATFFS
jgi:hypothetical protein